MTHIIRALNSRNYRLFYFRQGDPRVGTWGQRIAISWLVYRLTHSAFLLGLVGFAGQLPSFVFAPFAGVWVDRLDRKRILLWTQVVAMAQAIALAVLVLSGTVVWWQVMMLSMVLGLVNAFDVPARQAFVVEMIERREDLGNAIALNSSLVNIARLIGPSLAGILIAWVGEGACFAINAASYVAVLIALLMMRIPAHKIEHKSTDVWFELKEGFNYLVGSAPIRSMILLLALISLVGMPYQILMPVIAKDVLHGDSRELGFLMGAAGAGALLGAVMLASRKRMHGLMGWVGAATMLFGAGLILFSRSHWFWLSLPLLFVAGLGMMVAMAGCNTTIQSLVHDDKRGRIMSFFTMALMGMAPFGSLLAGSLAGAIGAENTIMFGGVACILGGVLFWSRLGGYRTQVSPILERKGL